VLNFIALLVLVSICGAISSQTWARKSKSDVHEALHNFTKWWFFALCAWLIVYVLLCIQNWPKMLTNETETTLTTLYKSMLVPESYARAQLFNFALMLVTFCVSYCFLKCYFVLSPQVTHLTLGITGFLVITFILIIIANIAHLGWLFSIGPDVQKLKEFEVVCVSALALLAGFINCVAMCLLFGRLESRILSPLLLLIFFMYCYGAMQIVMNVVYTAPDIVILYYPDVIRKNTPHKNLQELIAYIEGGMMGLLIFAAVLKATLFIFIYWLIDSGFLAFYLAWMQANGKINENLPKQSIDDERRIFLDRWHSPA
jgi:hypothetical protein